jgi:predicted house-cleaning noncanonical NTP pyrophosphatase (MazG superfamily)|tara:strand:- start:686 stop:1000 length:315 start_codon:yes stop_codon:yes gene_type:complete
MRPKLVRDCIPQLIEDSGRKCKWRKAYGEAEHHVLLVAKMQEEVEEFIENPSYEEAADILEVLKAFCFLNDLEFDSVIGVAENKQEERGGFLGGVILQEVEDER